MEQQRYSLDLYQQQLNQQQFCGCMMQSGMFKINIHLRVFVCRLGGFKVK